MEPTKIGISPTAVIAARVRQVRSRHGWTADQLAEKMAAEGVAWSRIVVTKLETGRRPSVSVEELLALATVLDVAPIDLMTPKDDVDQFYAVTPETATPALEAREWIRGRSPLPGQDPRIYFSELPSAEWNPPAWTEDQAELEGRRIARGRDGKR